MGVALEGLAAPARQLAALRIAVALALLGSPELRGAVAVAGSDRRLWVAPEGLGLFVAHAPVSPALAQGAYGVFVVAAALALMGMAARASVAVMTLSAAYLSALCQLSGSVLHHVHLLWMGAVLAASPCGDAWSLDAWGDPSRDLGGARTSAAYGVPVWTARALLAVVYFFPGFWKLRASGLAWVFSDNLLHQMQWKWFIAGGWAPAWRVDRHPALLRAMALAVVTFELSFPLLVLRRRGRTLAALGGLAFHLAADALMRIPFASLWITYVALVDWPAAPPSPAPRRALAASAVVGAMVLLPAAAQGIRGQTQSWPFACYPTFQWLAPALFPDVRVEAELADGRRLPVEAPRARSNARQATAWRVAGLYGDPVREGALRAWVDLVLADTGRRLPEGTARVWVWRAFYRLEPERRGDAPVREELLGSFTPSRATR